MMRSSSALANSTAGPSPSTSTWRSSCGCGCRSCLLSREGLLRVVALFSAFSLSHSLRPSVNQYFSSLPPPLPPSHPSFFPHAPSSKFPPPPSFWEPRPRIRILQLNFVSMAFCVIPRGPIRSFQRVHSSIRPYVRSSQSS